MTYTELPAYPVIVACDKYLDKRFERIEREREELIQKKMNRWLFPIKTREKAIKALDDGYWNSAWNRIEARGLFDAQDVENIRSLAVIALKNDANVRLDTDAVYLLKNFFK